MLGLSLGETEGELLDCRDGFVLGWKDGFILGGLVGERDGDRLFVTVGNNDGPEVVNWINSKQKLHVREQASLMLRPLCHTSHHLSFLRFFLAIHAHVFLNPFLFMN